jgi:hypothetical protein
MNWLSIKILNNILSKSCPDRIPRSGVKGKKVNCYSMTLYEGKNPKLLISSVNKFGYEGDHWAVDRFAYKASVPFHLGDGLNLIIEHYHGLVTHSYNGILDFVLHEFTWFYKVKTAYVLWKKALPQFFFDRKNLQLPNRMKILENIIEKQASEPKQPFSSHAMMTYLYSTRWSLHPKKENLRKKLELYLESFVASGEIEKVKNKDEYVITGKAIATLEKYQIETKRAKDAKKAQFWMLVLTLLLAIFSAFQSGLIKPIELFDLGKFCVYLKHIM